MEAMYEFDMVARTKSIIKVIGVGGGGGSVGDAGRSSTPTAALVNKKLNNVKNSGVRRRKRANTGK